jgi:hypothetical protein
MVKYSKKKQQYALALMSLPENLSVSKVVVRTGVSKVTLYLWQKEARMKGLAVPAGRPRSSADRALKLVIRYNGCHRHSAIGFVTPSERHIGQAPALLVQRTQVYEAARARKPRRRARAVQRWKGTAHVWLNSPPKSALPGRGMSGSFDLAAGVVSLAVAGGSAVCRSRSESECRFMRQLS